MCVGLPPKINRSPHAYEVSILGLGLNHFCFQLNKNGSVPIFDAYMYNIETYIKVPRLSIHQESRGEPCAAATYLLTYM